MYKLTYHVFCVILQSTLESCFNVLLWLRLEFKLKWKSTYNFKSLFVVELCWKIDFLKSRCILVKWNLIFEVEIEVNKFQLLSFYERLC